MNRIGSVTKPLMWFMTLLLVAFVAGCGDDNKTPGTGTGTGTVGAVCEGASCVPLGTAANYVILAKSLIKTTGVTAITGDIGISPAAATFVQGFSLTLDSTACFSTTTPASLVTGKVYAADYNTNGCTTPALLTTAVENMMTAYTTAEGRPAGTTELGNGDISGMTLAPGVYKWGTGVSIDNRGVTLSGGPTDVWIFQIAQNLTMASTARINLAGGALAKNIFWQVFGVMSVGTTGHFEGIALVQTAITLETGATANGRLLAQTAVTLDANTVVQPAQ